LTTRGQCQIDGGCVINWLYAQLHYFLNFRQLLVSCLPLLDKPINPGVSDVSSRNNNNQTHLD